MKSYAYYSLLMVLILPCRGYAFEVDICAEALGDFYAQRNAFLDDSSKDHFDRMYSSYRDLLFLGAELDTPLHTASFAKNSILQIHTLVSKGMSMKAPGQFLGGTPLHYAVLHGHVANINTLVDLGAEVNIPDIIGNSPLHYAARRNDEAKTATVEWLLEKGADIHQRDILGRTPIMIAVEYENQDVFNTLVSRGASLTDRNIEGHTLLHIALLDYKIRNRISMVEMILKAGRSELEIINSPDRTYGNTPLHWAAHKGYTDVMKILLERGARLDIKNNDGELPLHVAARKDRMKAFLMLRNANPSLLDVKNNKGLTPVDIARAHNSQKILSFLNSVPIQIIEWPVSE